MSSRCMAAPSPASVGPHVAERPVRSGPFAKVSSLFASVKRKVLPSKARGNDPVSTQNQRLEGVVEKIAFLNNNMPESLKRKQMEALARQTGLNAKSRLEASAVAKATKARE